MLLPRSVVEETEEPRNSSGSVSISVATSLGEGLIKAVAGELVKSTHTHDPQYFIILASATARIQVIWQTKGFCEEMGKQSCSPLGI